MRSGVRPYRHRRPDPLGLSALFPDETAASAAAFLALVHRWFATRGVVIRALLTDNGSAYRAGMGRASGEAAGGCSMSCSPDSTSSDAWECGLTPAHMLQAIMLTPTNVARRALWVVRPWLFAMSSEPQVARPCRPEDERPSRAD
jgi:hypothetical protein